MLATEYSKATKCCPICQVKKPVDEFVMQKRGTATYYPKYCRPCASKKVVANRKRLRETGVRLTPGRPSLRRVAETEGTRGCRVCGQLKPVTDFSIEKKGESAWRRRTCTACEKAQEKAWREAHPERRREHSRRSAERVKAARKLLKTLAKHPDAQALDHVRRALAEASPGVDGEMDSLQFFRGFIAGAKRTAEESERFERLKDLCHRIAAERRAHDYEERLSAAYEALLHFIRRHKQHDSLDHERRQAALAIRNGIIDALRREGPRKRHGTQRFETRTVSSVMSDDMHADALHPSSRPDHTEVELASVLERFEGRDRFILAQLAEGRTLLEVGRALGISESGACHAVKKIRERYPDLERMLAG